MLRLSVSSNNKIPSAVLLSPHDYRNRPAGESSPLLSSPSSCITFLSPLLSISDPPPHFTMSLPLQRSLPRTVVRAYGTVQGPASTATLASRIPSVLAEASAATGPRTNWSREEVSQIYNTPLSQLTYAAVSEHSNNPACNSSINAQETTSLPRGIDMGARTSHNLG